MNYYKKHWGEATGENLTNSWGTSTYYFEVDDDSYPTRQIQVFENGKVLKYHNNHMNDLYGGLSDQPLEADTIEEFKIDKIDQSEFENIWTTPQ